MSELNFEETKALLKGTEVEKFLNDKTFAYTEQERVFPEGRFVHLITGYNCNTHISFVQLNSGEVYAKGHIQGNYSGYRCYMTPDFQIHEDISYGFGIWTHKLLDHCLKEVSSTSEQDYGCCCG